MKIQELLQEIKVAALATLALLIVLCGVYPLVVWGIAQVAFPGQANGSLIKVKGQVVGSGLLAHPAAAWTRTSAYKMPPSRPPGWPRPESCAPTR
jgi:K+-transporting ATPase ATPase C chain